MKLEVGKRYKLADGVLRECTRMIGDDPCNVDDYGYGPFVVGGACYHQDGTHGSGINPHLNAVRCVDDETVTDSSGCVMCDLGVCNDTPTLWSDMTPEAKGALLLAHHEGNVIEKNNIRHGWISYQGLFCDNEAYRIKPEPKVETVVFLMHCDSIIPFIARDMSNPSHSITFNLIDGKPNTASIKMEEI